MAPRSDRSYSHGRRKALRCDCTCNDCVDAKLRPGGTHCGGTFCVIASDYRKCRQKLHYLTPLNTAPDSRCIECRETWRSKYMRKKHKPLPTHSGKCTKGLHKWIPENQLIDSTGAVRCKPCRQKAQRELYRRNRDRNVLLGQ